MAGANDEEKTVTSTTSQKQPARSVSRMRSTLLLKRAINRNQKFIAVQERVCRSMSSSSSEEEDDFEDGEDEGKEEQEEDDEFSTPEPGHVSENIIQSCVLPVKSSQPELSETSSSSSSAGCKEKVTELMERHAQKQIAYDVSDDSESDKNETVIDAVLAFQRWRQHNMKRSFSYELKKVLDEARRDEASLTSMQRELIKKDDSLVRAQAESAHLRAQISAIETAIQSQNSCIYNEDIARKEVHRAQERAVAAEEEVQKREKEIIRLKQRLKCLESEKGRVDCNVQASLTMLQNDKAGLLKENRALLDQLSRKDQELTLQTEKADTLETRLTSMAEYQAKMKVEHETAIESLQNRIRQEQDAKADAEKEVDSLTRKCESLTKEKESLALQLEKTQEKYDTVSMQYSPEGHARTSEAIAAGILEHLKILTGHMMKLEASFGRNNRGPGLYTSLHKIDMNLELALRSFRRSSSKAGAIGNTKLYSLPDLQTLTSYESSAKSRCMMLNQTVQTEVDFPETLEWSDKLEENYLTVRDARTQTSDDGELQVELYNYPRAVQQVARCVAWKWRWMSTAMKAKLLSKQLRYSRPTGKEQGYHSMSQVPKNVQTILGTMERELRASMPGHNIVPILLSLWRAYRRSPKSGRKAFATDVPVDKVLAMLPWWIRKVGEKRRLERAFYHWQHMASYSVKKQSYQLDGFYFHPHSCYNRPPVEEYQSVRRKVQKFKCQDNNSSDNNNGPQQGSMVVRKKDFEAERGLELAKPERRPLVVGGSYAGSTFTARALRTLQVSLHQEFQDLQLLLSKEMEAVQNQMSVGPFDNEKNTQRRRLTFLWEVCNNLANALMDAHKQLVSMDREFNQRVSNYLELAKCDPKGSPNSPRLRPRPRSPTKPLRQIDEMLRPLLKVSDDYNFGPTVKLVKKSSRPLQNCVNLTTIRKPSSAKRQACIASQCAAILQSEYRKVKRLDERRSSWTR